jgi:hypothetical protein
MIFKTVSGSGTIVSWSAELHQESVSKATAATSAQVSKFCSLRAIPGIKLLHLIVLTLTAVICVAKRYNIIAYLGWHRGKVSGCDTVSYELHVACLLHVCERFCGSG